MTGTGEGRARITNEGTRRVRLVVTRSLSRFTRNFYRCNSLIRLISFQHGHLGRELINRPMDGLRESAA